MAIGDLDGDSLKKLVAEAGEAALLGGLDQQLGVARSDEASMKAQSAASSAGVRMVLSLDSGAPDIPKPYVTALFLSAALMRRYSNSSVVERLNRLKP